MNQMQRISIAFIDVDLNFKLNKIFKVKFAYSVGIEEQIYIHFAKTHLCGQIKSNQIKSLLLSHHHSTSALVSEILMSVLQTVQKNNRQFTYGQTVQKKKQQTIYLWTDSAKKQQQTIYIWTDSAKNCTGAFTVLQTVQKKKNSNLHMDRQCKKATAIYIWTVHIYRLYRRQCAKYTYIYSVHIVYYKDILNYQRHIIHRMGTSALCTVSIHNVVYA